MTFTIYLPANTPGSGTLARRRMRLSSGGALESVDFRLTAVQPTNGATYTGPLNVDTLVPVTASNITCSVDGSGNETCMATITVPAPATDTFTVYTYATAAPIVAVTPPLSVYVGLALPVTMGANSSAVATWGVPASLAFSPSTIAQLAANTPLSGAKALTTSLQVEDANGAVLIGGNNFADINGVLGNVVFSGCDAHLLPVPATISAANPAALGSGTISVGYDGTAAPGSTMHCYASAPGDLNAQFTVELSTYLSGVGFTLQ